MSNCNWLPGLKDCGLCSRRTHRDHVRAGEGNKENPSIFFIAPEVLQSENWSDSFFTDAGKKLFKKALNGIGVWEDDCYITNTIKCWAPHDPNILEYQNCVEYLDKELYKIKPKLVVLMGDLACKYWFEGTTGMKLNEARDRTYKNNWQTVIATFHPDQVITQPELLDMWNDDWNRIGVNLRVKKD